MFVCKTRKKTLKFQMNNCAKILFHIRFINWLGIVVRFHFNYYQRKTRLKSLNFTFKHNHPEFHSESYLNFNDSSLKSNFKIQWSSNWPKSVATSAQLKNLSLYLPTFLILKIYTTLLVGNLVENNSRANRSKKFNL